jgi:hypothetical protein
MFRVQPNLKSSLTYLYRGVTTRMYAPNQSRRRAADIFLKSLERGDVGETTL